VVGDEIWWFFKEWFSTDWALSSIPLILTNSSLQGLLIKAGLPTGTGSQLHFSLRNFLTVHSSSLFPSCLLLERKAKDLVAEGGKGTSTYDRLGEISMVLRGEESDAAISGLLSDSLSCIYSFCFPLTGNGGGNSISSSSTKVGAQILNYLNGCMRKNKIKELSRGTEGKVVRGVFSVVGEGAYESAGVEFQPDDDEDNPNENDNEDAATFRSILHAILHIANSSTSSSSSSSAKTLPIFSQCGTSTTEVLLHFKADFCKAETADRRRRIVKMLSMAVRLVVEESGGEGALGLGGEGGMRSGGGDGLGMCFHVVLVMLGGKPNGGSSRSFLLQILEKLVVLCLPPPADRNLTILQAGNLNQFSRHINRIVTVLIELHHETWRTSQVVKKKTREKVREGKLRR